jgi:hypothetical protein
MRSIGRRYQPYLVQLPASASAPKEAAAVAAGRHRIGGPHSAGHWQVKAQPFPPAR